jgi:hypothetical protein
MIITNLCNSMFYTKYQDLFQPFIHSGFQTFLHITDTTLDNSWHAFNSYWFLGMLKEQPDRGLNFTGISVIYRMYIIILTSH